MLDGCYLDLFLYLEPLISLGSDILNESPLVLEELLETPPLMRLVLLASVDVRSKLASLEFLLLLGLPHRPQLSLLPIEEIVHFRVESSALPTTVSRSVGAHVLIHH
jgi:hypothetical protein